MKVTIKLLAGGLLPLDNLPADATVASVKSRIFESKGDAYAIGNQKLIHAGKILGDEVPVASLGLTEKDFLVCMATKPKAVSTASSSSSSPAVSAPVTTSVPAATTAVNASGTTAQSTEAAVLPGFTGVAMGSQFESAIVNLMEMGYERDVVVRAMRAAFNNPDRAAEYLMTGIPEGVGMGSNVPAAASAPAPSADSTATQRASQPSTPPAGQYVNLFDVAHQGAAANASSTAVPGVAGAAGANPLLGLRNSPQFQQMQQLIQSNPQLLQPLLQQLGSSNPQLLQAIGQNPEEFLQMLAGMGGAEGGQGEDDGEGEEGQGGAQYIEVTPEENLAVDRLVGLGFDRAIVIEAYFACDKNEELAANYLFDHMSDAM